MNAGHLCEHAFAHNRFVGRHGNAAVALHEARYAEQLALIDPCGDVEVVVQNSLHARQRCVAGSFSESVHSRVNALEAAEHSCRHVGDGQVVVVVSVEVEVERRVTPAHFAEETHGRERVEHAERVGQHEAAHRLLAECIDELVDILGRVFHSVGPVFEVHIHGDAQFLGEADIPADVRDVLFRRFVELKFAVAAGAFAEQVNDAATAVLDPVE